METLRGRLIEKIRIGLIGCYCAGLLGCGSPFGGSSQVDPNHDPGVTQNSAIAPAKDSEFISSSGQKIYTTDGKYQVYSSLGGPIQSLQGTTAHGYIYYLNVQGQILSSAVSP